MDLSIRPDEALLVNIRHPRHTNNEFTPDEAGRVIGQGQRLVKMGFDHSLAPHAFASLQLRSQKTVRHLLDGLDRQAAIIATPAFNSIEEVGDAKAKAFKQAAQQVGVSPDVALASSLGDQLVVEHGLPDRLVRASRVLAVWTTLVLVNAGKAVVVSNHNGYEIEPALALVRLQAEGSTAHQLASLPDPEFYIDFAGLLLMWFDAQTGRLKRFEHLPA